MQLLDKFGRWSTSGRSSFNKRKIGNITVIIPVFNAILDVQRCIQSVLKYTPDSITILVIDDCSPNPEVLPMLEQFEKANRQLRLVKNNPNLGYTRTVNKACKIARGDVVLLNSDTLVTKGWLELLFEMAYVDSSIATVTPVSNAAGAFSVPHVNQTNKIPSGYNVDSFSLLVKKLSGRKMNEAPTGNGFCMYIKRSVFERIGYFDEARFPRGYGEENDFCMRALKAGMKNVVDDRVFIFHKRSASFGESKNPNIENARQQLTSLHPDYSGRVQEFLAEHPLDELGTAIIKFLKEGKKVQFQSDAPDRKKLLFVIHEGGGGSVHTNKDLISNLDKRYKAYLLIAGVDTWRILDTELDKEVCDFRFDRNWNATVVEEQRKLTMGLVVTLFDIDLVHFRALIGTGPEMISHLHITKNVNLVFSFHDLYTICPTIQLFDDKNKFCGGVCNTGSTDCFFSPRWFGDITFLKDNYVYVWRKRMIENLRFCDSFITTSESTRKFLETFYGDATRGRFHVIEHGRDRDIQAVAVPPEKNKPSVVVTLGVFVSKSKGIDFLADIFRRNERSKVPPFEFHIFGTSNPAFRETAKIRGVHHHGTYERDELDKEMMKIKPSFSIIASLWPETYCHTLTESWFLGLPVFATSLGAVEERIEKHGGGWLLDYQDPGHFYERMVEIARNADEYKKKTNEIKKLSLKTKKEMSAEYSQIYLHHLDKNQ